MSGSPHDLRDYLFDELAPDERAEVELYLESSAEAREELERLKLTFQSLRSLPDEEAPRRIAFVSDKVFEPSVAMRMWTEFWGAAPRFALGLAAVLVAVSVGLWLAQPTLTADETGWQLAFGQSVEVPRDTGLAAAGLTEEQVRKVVAEAIAGGEERQKTLMTELIAQRSEESAAVWRAEIEALREESHQAWRFLRTSIKRIEIPYQASAELDLAGLER